MEKAVDGIATKKPADGCVRHRADHITCGTEASNQHSDAGDVGAGGFTVTRLRRHDVQIMTQTITLCLHEQSAITNKRIVTARTPAGGCGGLQSASAWSGSDIYVSGRMTCDGIVSHADRCGPSNLGAPGGLAHDRQAGPAPAPRRKQRSAPASHLALAWAWDKPSHTTPARACLTTGQLGSDRFTAFRAGPSGITPSCSCAIFSARRRAMP